MQTICHTFIWLNLLLLVSYYVHASIVLNLHACP